MKVYSEGYYGELFQSIAVFGGVHPLQSEG